MKFLILCLCISMAFSLKLLSQTSPITFGEVSRVDLETLPYPQEKGAEAVVLYDYATAKMIYNDGFKIEFTRHVRIKIFKAAGYDQANIQIPYTAEDRLSGLKAFTHNLENDQPVKVAVGKKQFYLEKVNAYRNVTRFSFPNVREGSVIEYIYTITQDEIRGFRSMRFQRNIPVRSFQYWATYPEFFRYTLNLNLNNIVKQEHNSVNGYYNNYSTRFHVYLWSGSNIPAFQAEPMMPESDEYLAGVDFALTDVNFPGGNYYEISPTYAKLTEKLLNNSMVGGQINNKLLFSATIKEITHEDDAPLKKMQSVYSYVQQHMQWNGYDQVMPDVSLNKAYREATGTNAEINLMLVNMLRTAGIQADPVVLSTRENGRINTFVAIANNIDYLICIANINGKDYLLDATDKFRPAGMLPFKCLNIEGWVLSPTRGRWVKLLNEESYTTREHYDLKLNSNGEFEGHAVISFSGYDAVDLRRLLYNEGEEGFREEVFAEAGNLTISNMVFQHTDSLESPLRLTFNVKFRHLLQKADQMVFFRPMISLFGDYVNSWVKDERNFPIDRGCPTFDSLTCILHLPDNYLVEELPKSAKILLPNQEAKFELGNTYSNNVLTITSNLTVSKTRFETNEYQSFREFYTQVNKKCNEMIIMKIADSN